MYNPVYALSHFYGAFEKIKGKIKGIFGQKWKIGTRECRKIKGSSVRSGWDSNPRYVAVHLISSQGRYDHFDTAPWQRANYITLPVF